MMSASAKPPVVGLRVTFIVIWTVILLVGLVVGLLVGIQGLAPAIQRAATATAASVTVAAVAAVAMILLGLWGIVGSYRNLKHSIDLMMEVDRARTETMQLETTRYLPKSK
jgi:hypothetical protein